MFDAQHEDILDRQLELKLMVGPRSEYYLRKWHALREKGPMRGRSWEFRNSWNWAGFIFSWFWLGYRKMYVPAAFCAAASVVALAISFAFGVDSEVSRGVTFGIFGLNLGIAMAGNTLYLRHLKKKIIEVESNGNDVSEQTLKSLGGTSWQVPTAAVVCWLAVVSIGTVIELQKEGLFAGVGGHAQQSSMPAYAKDISGVWQAADGTVVTVNFVGQPYFLGIGDRRAAVSIVGAGREGDSIEFVYTNRSDDYPSSIVQKWTSSSRFQLELIDSLGRAFNLGFVRDLTEADLR